VFTNKFLKESYLLGIRLKVVLFCVGDCWFLWRVNRRIQEFVKQQSFLCTSTEGPWRELFVSCQKLFFSPVAWLLQWQLPGSFRCPLKVSVQYCATYIFFRYRHYGYYLHGYVHFCFIFLSLWFNWICRIAVEGSAYSVEWQNGPKGPNTDADIDRNWVL
jgi:hypothetical protein